MSYQSKHTGAAIDASVDTTQKILNMIYPVGSIYMSVNNVSPATFIGGTWTALTDRVLIGAGSSYAVGTTGGATSHTHTSAAHTHTSAAHTHTTAGHTLTVNEMPSHTHATYGQVPRINDSSVSGDTYGHTSQQSWWFRSVAGEVKYAGGGASHSHGNTGSTTPGNTGSTTPSNTGSSSNLPPYLAVYMWKRTA